jgi:hypothetical protein
VGGAATLVTHFFDHRDPHGCPGDAVPGLDDRCSHDAYVGSLDLTLKSPSGDYALVAQAVGTTLVGGPAMPQPDGNVIGGGDSGFGSTLSVAKQGGENWLADAGWESYSPHFWINDAGYGRQSNYQVAWEDAELRTLVPTNWTINKQARIEAWQSYDWLFHRLSDNGINFNQSEDFTNFWHLFTELNLWPSGFDNRETRDGSFYERPHGMGASILVRIDSRKTLQVLGGGNPLLGTTNRGFFFDPSIEALVHTLPQLTLDASAVVGITHGDLRWVGTSLAASQRTYTFGFQDAYSVSATVRGTYAFSPRLTLQAYAQLFIAKVSYDGYEAARTNGSPTYIRFEQLSPASFTGNVAGAESALNVNVVLRWEYSLGSLLYLVYSHEQAGLPYNPIHGPPTLGAGFGGGPAADTLLLKVSYFWS